MDNTNHSPSPTSASVNQGVRGISSLFIIDNTAECFDANYKEITISYNGVNDTIYDFLNSFNNEVFGYILSKTNSENYNMVKLKLDLEMYKLQEDGEIMKKNTYIESGFLENIEDSYLSNIKKIILERYESLNLEGSGYIFGGIHSMKLKFANRGTSVTLGQFVPYPPDAPGIKSITNIDTNRNDCFILSLVAHFHRMKVEPSERSNPDSYIEHINDYFQFPEKIHNRVTFEDIPLIEKQCNLNIFLYQLKRKIFKNKKKNYQLKIIRHGKSPSVPEDRCIYLCKIDSEDEQSSHITLINNIQSFIRQFKQNYHRNTKFCVYCMGSVKEDLIQRHQKKCWSFEGEQNISMPLPGEKMKFRNLQSTEKLPFVAFFDTETILQKSDHPQKIHKHIMIAYNYIILNNKREVVRKKTYFGEDIIDDFLKNIHSDYEEVYSEFINSVDAIPCLTPAEQLEYDQAKFCCFCKEEFSISNIKNRHHSWTQTFIRDGRRSNYIGAACTNCNVKITVKRRSLTIFSHNGSKFDHKFLLHMKGKDFHVSNILAKGTEKLIRLEIQKVTREKKGKILVFLDSCLFLSSSLDTLSTNLKESGADLNILQHEMKKEGYSSEVIEMCKLKGIFPYEYMDSINKLKESKLPPHEEFFNSLKNSNVTPEEYARAVKLYEIAKCKTMLDFTKIYLETDVLLLAEVVLNFRESMMLHYGLDICQYNTTPAFSINAALYSSGIELDLISDPEMSALFESNIRGGITNVVTGRKIFNDPSLDNFDSKKAVNTGGFIDCNSLYSTILSGNLPVGEIYELNLSEVENFNYTTTPCDGEYAYALLIDFSIPDRVKVLTDDLPLGINQKTPKFEELSEYTRENMKNLGIKSKKLSQKLIACHEDQHDYLISLQMLKLYIELGIQVTKVRRIIRFKQSPCFKKYIEKNITLRKQSKNSFEKTFFKLLSNALYGRLLYNARKNSEVIKLITNKNRFLKLASSPFLKDCHIIDETNLLMNFRSSEIKLNTPLYIGWFVLELSKHLMYTFFYKVLKPHYKHSVSLLYMDTDSYFLNFKNHNFMEEITKFPLKEHMDLSNFNEGHPLYDDSQKGVLGKFKSELSAPAIDFICLQSKLYSVLLSDDTVKSAAKGVPYVNQKNLRHEMYAAIHRGDKVQECVNVVNISSKKSTLYTIRMKKRALCKIEQKRYWVNSEKSYAYGHPYIKKIKEIEEREVEPSDEEEELRIVGNKRCRENERNNIDVINRKSLKIDLSYRRAREGRKLFNIE